MADSIVLRQEIVDKEVLGMGAYRGIAEHVVNMCRKYPKAALILVPLTLWISISSFSTAHLVESLRENKPVKLRINRLYKSDASLFRSRYFISGTIEGTHDSVDIQVFEQEFNTLNVGNTLNVMKTNDPDDPYIPPARMKKELQEVRFSIGGIYFNDGAIFGCITTLVVVGWAFGGKWISMKMSNSKKEPDKPQPGKEG